MRTPARCRLFAAVGTGAVLLSAALATPEAAQSPTVRPTYLSALSPSDITRLSQNQTDRVIVLLKDQHASIPGGKKGSAQVRAAVLTADQSHLTDELHTLGATGVHGYSFVNAVSATMSPAEADRLATDPTVLAVVPDAIKSGSTTPVLTSDPVTAGSTPRAAVPIGAGAVAAPAPGVCPTNPAQPLLEPEALQTMNVDFGANAGRPAAHDLATGKGVKIAVFPDGLDPSLADFQRNGQSAIFDYVDFSGEGTGAVTSGAEAFGDASSLISQGTQVYDLSKHVNPAHPLPAGCTIRIKGVAPDASVAVMKVFGNTNLAFNSLILQGIEYAVLVDHVDILSQSFGGNPLPNDANDPVAVFDSDAVAAGITVVASSGDSGTTNTIGTPASRGDVIATAASTTYRLYAQTTSYGYQFGAGGWTSGEISALSSSGVTDYGPRTVDVLAPGEAAWSDCSPNTAVFQGCADIYNGAQPQPIEPFGGTSESCPLTAGTAALVIQGYRDTHGGATPSPALVKQIIMSTSQDVDVVAHNQGAGLVDALRAVQEARSVHDAKGAPAPLGQSLLYSPTSIDRTAAPGTSTTVPVTITNNGTLAQMVAPQVRALGAPTALAQGDLQLNQATDPTFVYQTGATRGDVHQVHFTVPAGVDRLVGRIAWLTDTQPSSTVRATYFDPQGRIVSHSRPQGAGGGFGEDEIHNPTPGIWTLLIFSTVPYTGPLHYAITGAQFHDVPASVTPSSKLVAPGASGTFRVRVTTPAAAGDADEAVVVGSSLNTGDGFVAPNATIPVTLRSLIPVGEGGGRFAGTLTGGNARQAFYGQDLSYQFDVPRNTEDLAVDVTVGAPGYQIVAILADPSHSPVDAQSSTYTDPSTGVTTNLATVHLSWHSPVSGRWSLNMAQINGVSSLRTSTPISGRIRFESEQVHATGLPTGRSATLRAGMAHAASVHVVNGGNSPEAFMVDPRLNASSLLSLTSLTPTTDLPLPIQGFNFPQFVVPPFSSELDMAATSTVPINFTTSPAFGTPEVLSASHGNNATVRIAAPDIAASVWACPPTELGPFPSGTAPATTFSCGAAAQTRTFDSAVTSSTGDIWSALEGLTATFAPLVLQPGQSGDIAITLTPSAPKGSVVSGFLAVETFNPLTFSSDQLGTLPYTYTVG